MKKEDSEPTWKQRAELQALEEMADEEIDTTDIPELTDWSGGRRRRFYRPVKQQITLRLDSDVVAWFREQAEGGRGYQTDINRALREHFLRRERETRTIRKSEQRLYKTRVSNKGPSKVAMIPRLSKTVRRRAGTYRLGSGLRSSRRPPAFKVLNPRGWRRKDKDPVV